VSSGQLTLKSYLSFRKEGKMAKTRVFALVLQLETLDLLFVDRKIMNYEIRAVVELKLACGTILGFKAE
jgi:hypothetical protein